MSLNLEIKHLMLESRDSNRNIHDVSSKLEIENHLQSTRSYPVNRRPWDSGNRSYQLLTKTKTFVDAPKFCVKARDGHITLNLTCYC